MSSIVQSWWHAVNCQRALNELLSALEKQSSGAVPFGRWGVEVDVRACVTNETSSECTAVLSHDAVTNPNAVFRLEDLLDQLLPVDPTGGPEPVHDFSLSELSWKENFSRRIAVIKLDIKEPAAIHPALVSAKKFCQRAKQLFCAGQQIPSTGLPFEVWFNIDGIGANQVFTGESRPWATLLNLLDAVENWWSESEEQGSSVDHQFPLGLSIGWTTGAPLSTECGTSILTSFQKPSLQEGGSWVLHPLVANPSASITFPVRLSLVQSSDVAEATLRQVLTAVDEYRVAAAGASDVRRSFLTFWRGRDEQILEKDIEWARTAFPGCTIDTS